MSEYVILEKSNQQLYLVYIYSYLLPASFIDMYYQSTNIGLSLYLTVLTYKKGGKKGNQPIIVGLSNMDPKPSFWYSFAPQLMSCFINNGLYRYITTALQGFTSKQKPEDDVHLQKKWRESQVTGYWNHLLKPHSISVSDR